MGPTKNAALLKRALAETQLFEDAKWGPITEGKIQGHEVVGYNVILEDGKILPVFIGAQAMPAKTTRVKTAGRGG